jgi:hypothetical protein
LPAISAPHHRLAAKNDPKHVPFQTELAIRPEFKEKKVLDKARLKGLKCAKECEYA